MSNLEMNIPKFASLEDLRVLVEYYDCEPIEPYAYIRFSNEAITLKSCLESIVPYIKKGIICYNEPLPGISDDGSLAIAQEFVAKNPGYKLVRYPFPVIFHNMPRYYDIIFSGATNKLWLLYAYSEYAMLYLKRIAQKNGDYDKAWVFKIDADHIYSAKLLEYTVLKSQLYYKQKGYTHSWLYKANVLQDLRENDLPQQGQEPWFLSMVNGYDHFFSKLDMMAPHVMRIINGVHGTEEEKRRKTQAFELPRFKPQSSANNDQVFLNSFHFFMEKLYHYQKHETEEQKARLINSLKLGLPVKDIDFSKMCDYVPEVLIDPEFFSYEFITKTIAGFNYADPEQMLSYGRESFDFDKFYYSEEYRPEYIVNFHNERWAKRDEITDPEEREDLEIEHWALHEMVKPDGLPELWIDEV
ncbi:hypothetical protein [Psittacicella hinzii]|uniref:Uncharacterized protein n=1 Tax=Psittacicella hinzii TaxID=2028575 RepID=A0A3A1YIY7_9GAMM|nr:hypothetical protein [Psittacicella hinzii]RIY37168.1 hypothetical protein CKF58_05105 [Psittacicella hinzii]